MRFEFHHEEGVRILTSHGAKVKKPGSESERISRKLYPLKITDQAAASPLTCDRGERRRPTLTRHNGEGQSRIDVPRVLLPLPLGGGKGGNWTGCGCGAATEPGGVSEGRR